MQKVALTMSCGFLLCHEVRWMYRKDLASRTMNCGGVDEQWQRLKESQSD